MGETSKPYTTPPGVDEREVPFPTWKYTDEEIEALKKRGIKCLNWNGFKILSSTQNLQYSTKIFDEIMSRVHARKSNVLIVTGAPGEGKTYLAISMAQIFDSTFDPYTQIVFSREHLFKIFSGEIKLSHGQCLIIDESHFGIGARTWSDADQKQLANLIAAARSKGLMIFIVVLHISMIDKIVRMHVPSYQIHLERRGLGTVYRLTSPRFAKEPYKQRVAQLDLPLPDSEKCARPDCLGCSYLNGEKECHTIRAIYERRKVGFIDDISQRARDTIEERKKRSEIPSDNKLLEHIFGYKDKIEYTNRGTIDFSSIVDIVDILGYNIGRSKAQLLGQRLQRRYKELKP